MKMKSRTTDDQDEEQRVQDSIDKLKREGFTLTSDAMKQAEYLINDGMPLTTRQARQLAGFLRMLTVRTEGRHKG